MDENGVKDFTMEEIEQLLNSESEQTSPTANDTDTQTTNINDDNGNTSKNQTVEEDVSQTKAFAKRLKQSTEKARLEEREAIAKSLGYDNYEDLQNHKQKQMLEDEGLDPETVSPIIDKLVKSKLDNDPRMIELEELRKKQIEEFGKQELAEITKLTNGEITALSQLPKEVINLWKTKGSLKSAYLELEGEKLITKIRSEQSRGSTSHLQNLNGNINNSNSEQKRHLTEEEKRIWKVFDKTLSEEDLNKKMIKY